MFWAHGYVNGLVNQTMVSKKLVYDPIPTSKIKTFSAIVKMFVLILGHEFNVNDEMIITCS